MREKKSFLEVREMVEIALLVAIAIILDLDGLKISLGANGGSIGFTMLPLIILGLRHGFIKGLIAVGFIYGFTTNILDGWGIIYYPFDYFVAYGLSISLVGLFSKVIFEPNNNLKRNYLFLTVALILVGVVRTIGHTLSSMIFYEYTLDAALSYNLVYVGPSLLICMIVMYCVYPSLLFINKRFPTTFLKKISE